MDKVRIGLIGAGIMGSYGHFPGYMEIPTKAKVVAICDKNPKAVANLVEKSGAKGYSSFEDLLNDSNVDAVRSAGSFLANSHAAESVSDAPKPSMVWKRRLG